MVAQRPATFGAALREALRDARLSQAGLARQLNIDPGQVSRWANNKAVPHSDTLHRVERILGADLAESFSASTPSYELYISAPISGLEQQDMLEHHFAVSEVVSAAKLHVNTLYWPGEKIRELSDLSAPDIATERNMKALTQCSAFLYLQFAEVVHPSSALIELGVALGRRLKTTVFIQKDVRLPYMLNGFSAVAASLGFLPKVRIYEVKSREEACKLITNNGRELLGLT